jgi:hypothetical protein
MAPDHFERVDAGHDEEQTRSLGPAGNQTSQTEDDGALIFLGHFEAEK